MNAIELLKKDHRTVESLFESFEKAKEQDKETSKAELFASIKEELDAHARVEEEIFYPAFDQAAEGDDDKELVLEAAEEHKQVKTLLAELEGLDPDDETFDAKMKVLKDNIEHHVEEEEKEMFPHAQRQLGSETLEELGDRIAAAKERLQQGVVVEPAGSKRPAKGRASSGPKPASQARTTAPKRQSGRAPSPKGANPSSATGRASGSEPFESVGVSLAGGASSSGRARSSSTRRPVSTKRATAGRKASSRPASGRPASGRSRSSSSARSASGRASSTRPTSGRARSSGSRSASQAKRRSASSLSRGRSGRARSRSTSR